MTATITPGHHHVSLSVSDLDRRPAWYRQNPGFETVVERYEIPGRRCAPPCSRPPQERASS